MRRLVVYEKPRKPNQYVVYVNGVVAIITTNAIIARRILGK